MSRFACVPLSEVILGLEETGCVEFLAGLAFGELQTGLQLLQTGLQLLQTGLQVVCKSCKPVCKSMPSL